MSNNKVGWFLLGIAYFLGGCGGLLWILLDDYGFLIFVSSFIPFFLALKYWFYVQPTEKK